MYLNTVHHQHQQPQQQQTTKQQPGQQQQQPHQHQLNHGQQILQPNQHIIKLAPLTIQHPQHHAQQPISFNLNSVAPQQFSNHHVLEQHHMATSGGASSPFDLQLLDAASDPAGKDFDYLLHNLNEINKQMDHANMNNQIQSEFYLHNSS
jgi:hypothetical protein